MWRFRHTLSLRVRGVTLRLSVCRNRHNPVSSVCCTLETGLWRFRHTLSLSVTPLTLRLSVWRNRRTRRLTLTSNVAVPRGQKIACERTRDFHENRVWPHAQAFDVSRKSRVACGHTLRLQTFWRVRELLTGFVLRFRNSGPTGYLKLEFLEVRNRILEVRNRAA